MVPKKSVSPLGVVASSGLADPFFACILALLMQGSESRERRPTAQDPPRSHSAGMRTRTGGGLSVICQACLLLTSLSCCRQGPGPQAGAGWGPCPIDRGINLFLEREEMALLVSKFTASPWRPRPFWATPGLSEELASSVPLGASKSVISEKQELSSLSPL